MMFKNKIQCFLPCRAGSMRVRNKNSRPFHKNKSLFDIKIQQLLSCTLIDTILFSTDDQYLVESIKRYKTDKIIIDYRPKKYAANDTSTGELIKYASTILQGEHILWTHVTSPFITESDYSTIIQTYFESLDNGFDSLMTVTRHQKFILNHKKQFNYDRGIDAWPRTQTLAPLYEVDSGAFIAPLEVYRSNSDRIGANCFLYEQPKLKSLDIDESEDFEICKLIYEIQQI